MFEGLFSPWHLVIIAFFVFMVIGPRRIADRMTGAKKKLQQLTDGEPQGAPGPGTETDGTQEPRVVARTGLYRLAPLFRRRP